MLTELGASEQSSSSAASSSAGELLRSFGEELQLATSYLTTTQARRAWTRAAAARPHGGTDLRQWAIAAEGQEPSRPAARTTRTDLNPAPGERDGGGSCDEAEAGHQGARRRVSAWLLGSGRTAAAQPNHGSVSFTPAKPQPEAAQQQPPAKAPRFEYCAQRAQQTSQAAHAKLHRVELTGEGADLRLLQPRAFPGRQPRPRTQTASLPGPQPKPAAAPAQQQICASCGGRCLHTCHHHHQQRTQQQSHTVTFALPQHQQAQHQQQAQQQQKAQQQAQEQQQQPFEAWHQEQTSFRHHHRSHRYRTHRTHQTTAASAEQEQQRAAAAAQHISHPGPCQTGLGGGGTSGGSVRFADPCGVVAQLQAMRSKMRSMQTEIVTFLQTSTASDADLEALGNALAPLHYRGGGARPGSAGSCRSEALTRLKGLRRRQSQQHDCCETTAHHRQLD